MQHHHTPVSRQSSDGDVTKTFSGETGGMLLAANLLARLGAPFVMLDRKGEDGKLYKVRIHGDLRNATVEIDPEHQEEPPPPKKYTYARLAWLPEGFLFKPINTGSAPNGWGLPYDSNGELTRGGPMAEVLLNRKKNNQYPRPLNNIVAKPVDILETAPTFFMEWEREHDQRGIGTIDKTTKDWRPQFDAQYKPLWREPDGGEWFCHRPIIVEEGAWEVEMREFTNRLRRNVGRPDVGAPILGYNKMLGPTTLYAIRESKVFGHDSYLFPQGYESYDWRAAHRLTNVGNTGENLQYGATNTAEEYIEAWRNSPPHYANIIADWHQGNAYAWAEHFETTAPELNRRQYPHGNPPKYELGSPEGPLNPIENNVTLVSQHFQSNNRWLLGGSIGRDVDVDDRVGLSETPNTYFFPHAYQPRTTFTRDGESFIRVHYRGKAIIVSELDSNHIAVIGAKIIRTHTPPKLRVAVLERYGSVAAIIIFEGDLNDFLETRTQITRYRLPDKVGLVSTVKFSDAGKAVFSYSMPEASQWFYSDWNNVFDDYPFDFHNTAQQYSHTDFGYLVDHDLYLRKSMPWGAKLHFMRFDDAFGWGEIHISEVGVTREVQGNTVTTGCDEEYNVLADFSGETIVYLKAHIESSISTEITASHSNVVRHLKGKLIFPNGEEFEYQDNELSRTGVDMTGNLSGFFTILMHVDVLHPENLCYAKLELSDVDYPGIDVSIYIKNIMVAQRTEAIKMTSAQNNYTSMTGQNRVYRGYASMEQLAPISPVIVERFWIQTSGTTYVTSNWGVHSFVDYHPFKAVYEPMNHPRLTMPMSCSDTMNHLLGYQGNQPIIPQDERMGPIFLGGGNNISWFQIEFHEGEWFAAWDFTSFFPSSRWFPTKNYYSTSLGNVQTLVGKPFDSLDNFGIV